MACRFDLPVLLMLISFAPPARALLLSNEDRPSFIDRVLQVVWEPSSLIRVWVGLDQLYNIALSWKGVAKSLTSLPFGEGRSASHVMIQQPRSLKYHKPSVASQWDRFNEIYASSSLSPIVADARNRPAFLRGGHFLPLWNIPYLENGVLGSSAPILPQQQSTVSRNALDYRKESSSLLHLASYGPTVFRGDLLDSSSSVLSPQQGVVLNPVPKDSLKNPNEIQHFPLFVNMDDPLVTSKFLYFQNQKSLQHAGSAAEQPGAALDSNHQQRLTAFLEVLRTLGDIHAKDVARDSLQTSDD